MFNWEEWCYTLTHVRSLHELEKGALGKDISSKHTTSTIVSSRSKRRGFKVLQVIEASLRPLLLIISQSVCVPINSFRGNEPILESGSIDNTGQPILEDQKICVTTRQKYARISLSYCSSKQSILKRSSLRTIWWEFWKAYWHPRGNADGRHYRNGSICNSWTVK